MDMYQVRTSKVIRELEAIVERLKESECERPTAIEVRYELRKISEELFLKSWADDSEEYFTVEEES